MFSSSFKIVVTFILCSYWIGNVTYGQGILTPKPKEPYIEGITSIFGYYEYLPLNYQIDSTEQFPLLIYLSGLGSKGDGINNLEILLEDGIAELISEGLDLPFIVMTPQSWSGWWGSENVDAYLDFILTNYRVDTSRIYITGFSAGGVGAFTYAVDFPNEVTAIVPISGRGDNLEVCNMVDVPVWAFHNVDDKSFSYRFSAIPISNLNQCEPAPTPKARLTIYPEGGHDAWTKTYNNSGMGTEDPAYNPFDTNIYDWLLQFAKDTLIVDVGEDQVVFRPQTEFQLEAYVASHDGLHTNIWNQLKGPEIEIQDQGQSVLTVSDAPVGEYVFEVMVKDNFGRSSSDTVKVWVRPPNAPPSINIEKEQTVILPIDSITLSGSVADPENDIFSLTWNQEDGPGGAILQFDSIQSDSAQLVVRNLQAGEYTFRLNATDEYDSVGTQTTKLRVIAPSSTAVRSLPYLESFEETSENWQSHGTTNSWEQGKPEGTTINQASDGDQVWATNLAGNYQADESSFLMSPIFDFSDLTNDPTISYDIWIDTDATDSTYLSITYNNGATWAEYGLRAEDTMDQDSDRWSRVSHIIKGAAGQESVVFRFGLESGSDASGEGIAIDNVVLCSTGKIISIPDTMLVEGESLQIPIESDNPDISGVAYQATSSNQEVLPDQNITISENLLEITSPLQVEGETEITVSSEQACVDGATFTLTVTRVTAIGEPNRSSPAILYPNPGTGLYQIKAEQPIREIRLYGVAGRLLKVYPSNSSTKRQFSLDINDQPNGIYHLQVETAKQSFRQQLIKY